MILKTFTKISNCFPLSDQELFEVLIGCGKTKTLRGLAQSLTITVLTVSILSFHLLLNCYQQMFECDGFEQIYLSPTRHNKTSFCPEEWLWVKWDNGEQNVYRYGDEGNYDVLLADGLPRIPDSDDIQIGVRVTRGRRDM